MYAVRLWVNEGILLIIHFDSFNFWDIKNNGWTNPKDKTKKSRKKVPAQASNLRLADQSSSATHMREPCPGQRLSLSAEVEGAGASTGEADARKKSKKRKSADDDGGADGGGGDLLEDAPALAEDDVVISKAQEVEHPEWTSFSV